MKSKLKKNNKIKIIGKCYTNDFWDTPLTFGPPPPPKISNINQANSINQTYTDTPQPPLIIANKY